MRAQFVIPIIASILILGTFSLLQVFALTEDVKLTALDAAAGDRFGRSVSISGDTAIVGATRDDDACPLFFPDCNTGSAYIFVKSGTIWTQEAKLTASDASANDSFGFSVSISGDTAIVGSLDDNSKGSAYIFAKDQGGVNNWGEVKKITASDAAAFDAFGQSVSISGDTAIVSAVGNDDAGDFSGSAYVFAKDQGGVNNWGEVKKITASDEEA